MSDDEDKTMIVTAGVRKPPPPARLSCIDLSVLPEGTGNEVRLVYDEVTIGRAAGNAVVIAAAGVSGKHARFIPSETHWSVEDVGSSNGITINGQLITGETVLKHDDEVAIGVARYRFVLADAQPTAPLQSAPVSAVAETARASDQARPAPAAKARAETKGKTKTGGVQKIVLIVAVVIAVVASAAVIYLL